MNEHGGEQGQETRGRVDVMGIVPEEAGRLKAVGQQSGLEARAEGQLPDEDEDVDSDDRPGEERNALAGDRVSERDHGLRSDEERLPTGGEYHRARGGRS